MCSALPQIYLLHYSDDYILGLQNYTKHSTTKQTKWPVHPAKTQISLHIHAVWWESSLSGRRSLRSLTTLKVQSEGYDQTGQRPRLIWVFAVCTCHFVGFVVHRLSYYIINQMHIANISPHLPYRYIKMRQIVLHTKHWKMSRLMTKPTKWLCPQADLSLCWVHSHFVGFVMRRLTHL